MRLLLFLNEAEVRAHEDIYRACEFLRSQQSIVDYKIYPFLSRLVSGISEQSINQEILELVNSFRPDLVLWMHTGKLRIYEQTWKNMLDTVPLASWGYWDGDMYCHKYRPVPREMIEIARRCNVVFLQGFGETSDYLAQQGCSDIRYVPAFCDEVRFPRITNIDNYAYDVVFIGNNITSRNPFRPTMDGTKLRKNVVAAFQKQYGSKFGVYGNGWSGSSAKGAILFSEQLEVYRNSKITIGINNVHSCYYFSNRLPISMHCGIPIVHSFETGLEVLFAECKDLLFFSDVDQALYQARYLLQKNEEEIMQIGNNLHQFASNYLTANFVFLYMVNVLGCIFNNKNSKDSTHDVPNPWI